MSEHVYKIVELAGSSRRDMEGAVGNALARASRSIRGMRWFEVTDVRGRIENERVAYWQVTLKIGFNVEAKEGGGEEQKAAEKKPAEKERKKEGAKEGLAKYKCTVCGYVYEPAKGDPDNGVKPGTPFEKLPGDWTCPECGVGKDKFEKI